MHLNSRGRVSIWKPISTQRSRALSRLSHPLELFADVAWETYCPVSRLGEFVGQNGTTCGLIIEQRTHHQITGEPMKLLMLADWTGMVVETELFADTCRSCGLATVRYLVVEVEASQLHLPLVQMP